MKNKNQKLSNLINQTIRMYITLERIIMNGKL